MNQMVDIEYIQNIFYKKDDCKHNFVGKNDGCVSGKRYFQCEPKKGIFSRLERLTREPLNTSTTDGPSHMDHSMRSMISPARSGTVSPTHSLSSNISRTPGSSNTIITEYLKKKNSIIVEFTEASTLSVGDRVIVSSGLGSRAGVLQYLGETKFATGTWCGVQLNEASGKNNGTVDGHSYFEFLCDFQNVHLIQIHV